MQDGALAALDLLSVTNFVNYFGKSNSVEEVISMFKVFFFLRFEKKKVVFNAQNSSPNINAKRKDQVSYIWTRKYPRREITPNVFSKKRYYPYHATISLLRNDSQIHATARGNG